MELRLDFLEVPGSNSPKFEEVIFRNQEIVPRFGNSLLCLATAEIRNFPCETRMRLRLIAPTHRRLMATLLVDTDAIKLSLQSLKHGVPGGLAENQFQSRRAGLVRSRPGVTTPKPRRTFNT